MDDDLTIDIDSLRVDLPGGDTFSAGTSRERAAAQRSVADGIRPQLPASLGSEVPSAIAHAIADTLKRC